MSKSFFSIIKYCPNCGAKYKPENIEILGTMKCENCDFRNYVKTFPTVAAIIPNKNNPNEIILAKRAFDPGKDEYSVVGGFIDYNEPPELAIKRELKEELNVDSKIDQVIHIQESVYIQNDIEYPTIEIFYLMKPLQVEDLKLNEENLDLKSIQIKDILSGKFVIYGDQSKNAVRIYSELLSKNK